MYIIKLNQRWHKQPGATPRMWGESIKDSCSVLIPYQFQQVGRRAALLGQGPFQQSFPVLVFLTHTWGESKWVFFSPSNNHSTSAPSLSHWIIIICWKQKSKPENEITFRFSCFMRPNLRGAHRFMKMHTRRIPKRIPNYLARKNFLMQWENKQNNLLCHAQI